MSPTPKNFYGPYLGRMWTNRELADKANIHPCIMATRLKTAKGKISKRIFRHLKKRYKYYIIDEDNECLSLTVFCAKHDLDYRRTADRVRSGCVNPKILKKPPFSLIKGELQYENHETK